MRVIDLDSIKIKLASPEDIFSWSHGEVTKPETINYRTQRSEKDGLFCERIFGPTKDYQCYCGKYKGVRFKEVVCDRCGVEVTKSQVRRERMGHLNLATPCSHIWFLRGMPSRMGQVLDLPMQKLEKVIYFSAYIITKVDKDAQKKILDEIEKEYKTKVKAGQNQFEKDKKKLKNVLQDLKDAREKARKEVSELESLKILSEIDYQNLALKYGEVFEAETGAEALVKIFKKIDLKEEIEKLKKQLEKELIDKKKILRRLKLFKKMQEERIRPEWMFWETLPILPPDLRPMVQLEGGRFASSDLNDLYRRVINRNNRLKYLLEISAPEVIVRNEKRMLQEAVDALIDNGMRKAQTTRSTTGGKRLLKSLADMLKGKEGRFRRNLLGKRVDYSGRSVIVVGPELKLSEVGLPKKMALELFKPFVIHKVLNKELAYNVRGASRLIEEKTPEVWALLEEVVQDKLVLLNRAPTLHRLGIQAFKPVLVEGEALRIHPMVCQAFNADFDGDQMAVFVPLSQEAQKEARELMFSSLNLLKPATGTPVMSLSKDIVLGCYWMTTIKEGLKGEGKVLSSPEEAILSESLGYIDLRAKIKIKIEKDFIETSVGRIIFNQALPVGFPFQNIKIKIKDLKNIVSTIIEEHKALIGYEPIVEETLDKIKNLGFEYSTRSGISWGMDDLQVPAMKPKILEEAENKIDQIEKHFQKGLLSEQERDDEIISTWQEAKNKIEKEFSKTLSVEGSVYTIVDSGSRGSWSQPVQMAGMKGLVTNPMGNIIKLPVKSSYKEGLNVLEYFNSTHGARKGTADTALRTAKAGYLTRRLVDVAHEVIVIEEDCGDRKGILVFKKDAEEIGQSFLYKILGRVCLDEVKIKGKVIVQKGDLVDFKKAKIILDSEEINEVRVKSPLSCKTSRGVCRQCYGWDLGRNQLIKMGEAVGVIAAQAIGEPGTQLTLMTFHTGGVAGGGDITQGLPRVEEVLELRSPAGEAVMSQVDGKIISVDAKKGIIKIAPDLDSKKLKEKEIEYLIPLDLAMWVKPGQKVKRGTQLCEGSLNLKKLFKLTSLEETWRYVVQEIQKIYSSQGVDIHDKHIETIARQMFSRVRIKDSGDSDFIPGEIAERSEIIEENEVLKKANKNLIKAVPILLGISKVALTTKSFLSAASFQETSRILIKAAIEGREDKLLGLKENVIIGKLIPAGTGFKIKQETK
ncbi:MAG: DNA-directed RNA polymerase subunit beta' [Candidatus Nealsonbacteria bacterium]|nr:DNA-directed RNA polymerase subunit beta' [Candidatus Nealsonbacteria bacterium]